MKKQLLTLLALVSMVSGLSAAQRKKTMQGTRMTIHNKTKDMAHVEIEKENSLGEISGIVRPGQKRTFMAKDHCFDEVEVRLGSARIFGRRETEIKGGFCGEHMIEILPDNTERGFHLKLIK